MCGRSQWLPQREVSSDGTVADNAIKTNWEVSSHKPYETDFKNRPGFKF